MKKGNLLTKCWRDNMWECVIIPPLILCCTYESFTITCGPSIILKTFWFGICLGPCFVAIGVLCTSLFTTHVLYTWPLIISFKMLLHMLWSFGKERVWFGDLEQRCIAAWLGLVLCTRLGKTPCLGLVQMKLDCPFYAKLRPNTLFHDLNEIQK